MREIEEIYEFEVSEEHVGRRLDKFLSEACPELSRSYIKKLIQEGFVFVNSQKVDKPSRKLKGGDKVVLYVPEPEPLEIKPEPIPIEIIYEDEDIAVIKKPCGLVVHPSPGYTSGTLVNALLYHIRDLSSIGGAVRPGIVHRLDKDTAGIMVVAKNDKAHRSLVEQFSNRKVLKLYKVLVSGIVEKDHVVVDMPIGRHPVHRKKFSVFSKSPKEAKTEFWVLERFPKTNVTLLKVKIYTGRTHQIRVHASFMGHPVLGDITYGFKRKSVPEDLLKLMKDCNMLIAYKLGFFHPTKEKYLKFEIEDPEPFRSVLEKLRAL